MKRHVLMMMILLAFLYSNGQQPLTGKYSLELHFEHFNPTPDSVFLSYYNQATKKRVSDTATVRAGAVVFRGEIEEPVLVQLRVNGLPDQKAKTSKSVYPRDYYSVFLEPAVVQVIARDSLHNSKVSGSQVHLAYLGLQSKTEPYEKEVDRLEEQYDLSESKGDAAGKKKAEQAIDSVENEIREKVYKPFVLANADKSPLALYALSQYAGYDLNPDSVEPLYQKLDLLYRSLPSGKDLGERIELSKQIAIGKPALEFAQADTSGNIVRLSSFRGKYVLIDFWASWCGPCRAENPNVVKAFSRFRDKEFTIVGISLDRPGQKEKWLKAIHDDHLYWNQVSDLQFWNNAVAKQYGIVAIPQNILLDPRGIIIAKNLHGDELEKKLKELLN